MYLIVLISLHNALNKNHLENIILVKCNKSHKIFFFLLEIISLLISNSDVTFLNLINAFLL